MRVAIIDMGTNTFHLLIADVNNHDYQIIFTDRTPVRIGVGGINQNIILEDGMSRAIKTLQQFKNKIDEVKASNVFAFGTSAIRNAKNKNEMISKIKEATSIDAKIISGDDEAQFIYEGVNLALNLDNEKTLIIDIGGGSVEFIIGNGKEIFWKQSIEIGGQRLLEEFQKHDPILKSEIDELNLYLEKKLSAFFEAMNQHSPKILAGSSGTFDTLSDIFCYQEGIDQKKSSETPLTISAFHKIYSELVVKNRAARMEIPGMIEMRVDMIVVACCLIKFILDRFQFEQIRVSSFSLKEGVLASLMKGKKL